MKTNFFGEMSPQIPEARVKFFKEFAGPKWELQWEEVSLEILDDPVAKLKSMKEWAGFFLAPAYSRPLLEPWGKAPAEVGAATLADSVVKQNGQWWFRCFLKTALLERIVRQAPQLNTHSTAYVTGSGPLASMSVAAVIQLGFKKISLVSSDRQESQQLVDQMNRKYFGVNVQMVADSELILQPNNGSLLMNTIEGDAPEEMLQDLPYMNFLDHSGLVVDLAFHEPVKPLHEEAESVGVSLVAGAELLGHRDFLFLSTILGEKMDLSLEQYLTEWKTRL